MTTEAYEAGEQGPRGRGTRGARARALTGFGIGLAGSAILGLLGGVIWGEVAPRAMLQSVGGGAAEIINSETPAFIGADAWYCGIALVAGLLTGVLGYRFLVARRADGDRAAAACGLILGAVAGALVMMWLGGQFGLSAYNHSLASAPAGAVFPASLALGAKSALAFWPGLTAIVILVAEWSARSQAAYDDQEPSGYGTPPATALPEDGSS
jgi:hypothetical protein